MNLPVSFADGRTTDAGSREALIDSAAALIRERLQIETKLAVILGSGLGGLTNDFTSVQTLEYDEIPGWARSTCAGHRGRLVYGQLEDCPVLALAGRFHRYEGWSSAEITFPIEVLAKLGVTTLVVSNAAGGVAPRFRIADIMLIVDHIDLQHGRVPLRFGNLNYSGVARVDGLCARGRAPYDPQLIEIAMETARQRNFAATCGTYWATLGPNYETRAEYRMMRRLGADVVGMSTVPEVLCAQRHGMRVLAMSMVSNIACPDVPIKADHDEVLAAGTHAAPKMQAIVAAIARSMHLCH